MPAKRKALPRRCPKCGLRYGTVQMVFFAGRKKPVKTSRGGTRTKEERYSVRHKAVIRIGHYSNFSYNKTKKENLDPFNHDDDEVKRQKLRSSQRHWCSFRSYTLDDCIGYVRPVKTITEPISPEVWNEVIRVGWDVY